MRGSQGAIFLSRCFFLERPLKQFLAELNTYVCCDHGHPYGISLVLQIDNEKQSSGYSLLKNSICSAQRSGNNTNISA
ncbi:unnamed protein product [Acanthoscelides obtectus]|uniref:Uncharacterized protein n=1 Tax=Acanthoscelides obtectus TaxID=200917 RepID=A0A9P0KYW1_ACAOB|nr:unnamed protein product [Acanthoscelides obtectus]CAK1632833.1 hypothetical protein AOBTE_LOCUS7756 [Acanthoscelides obtectus]